MLKNRIHCFYLLQKMWMNVFKRKTRFVIVWYRTPLPPSTSLMKIMFIPKTDQEPQKRENMGLLSMACLSVNGHNFWRKLSFSIRFSEKESLSSRRSFECKHNMVQKRLCWVIDQWSGTLHYTIDVKNVK